MAKVEKDGIVFEIADNAVVAAVRNGYKVAGAKAEKTETVKEEKEAKKK